MVVVTSNVLETCRWSGKPIMSQGPVIAAVLATVLTSARETHGLSKPPPRSHPWGTLSTVIGAHSGRVNSRTRSPQHAAHTRHRHDYPDWRKSSVQRRLRPADPAASPARRPRR